MILKLIKKLLHHFNYEVVSFAEMTFIKNKIESVRIDGKWFYVYDCVCKCYFVYCHAADARVIAKTFKIEDYGSIDYARACAEELCEKLNEKP